MRLHWILALAIVAGMSSAVRAEEAEAHRLGVQGVPFFIVNGEVALSGAQEPKMFLEAFTQASNAPQAGGRLRNANE